MIPSARILFLTACLAGIFWRTAGAQSSDPIAPGPYLLIRSVAGDSPVVPNALVLPAPIFVEHISVIKDPGGRLTIRSDEAPELSGEIHQVENFLSFVLIRSQPHQKILQTFTYLCEVHPHADGAFSGAFTALGRTGGASDGLGGGFKREGSFLLCPVRPK